jgi:hypothetical protein
MIIFENDGEIDPRAITTFGVNVKEHENPIGFFGTGLKYALAVLLRTEHQVVIQSGMIELRFHVEPTLIRGKEFGMIVMHDGQSPPVEMGITTELGKRWKPWMAYRELYCNAMDERGEVALMARPMKDEWLPQPVPGKTRVIVGGAEIEAAHVGRADFLLGGTPVFKSYHGEIRLGQSKGVFYRGVRVLTLEKPAALTYNILAEIKLTEDRTAESEWETIYHISHMLAECKHEEALKAALLAPEGFYERGIDFAPRQQEASTQFLDVVAGLIRDTSVTMPLNPSATKVYHERVVSRLAPSSAKLTAAEDDLLADAIAFVARTINVGNEKALPVHVAESLGEGRTSLTRDGAIYLSRPLLADRVACAAALVAEIMGRNVEKLAAEIVRLGDRL